MKGKEKKYYKRKLLGKTAYLNTANVYKVNFLINLPTIKIWLPLKKSTFIKRYLQLHKFVDKKLLIFSSYYLDTNNTLEN